MSRNIYGRFTVNPQHIKKLNKIQKFIEILYNDQGLQINDNLHCTCIYVPDVQQIENDIRKQLLSLYKNEEHVNVQGTIKGFEKFGNCLVVLLDFPEATKRHNKYVEKGYIHSFPSYEPHVTLFDNFPHQLDKLKELETEIFGNLKTINFNYYKIEELEGFTGTNEIKNTLQNKIKQYRGK